MPDVIQLNVTLLHNDFKLHFRQYFAGYTVADFDDIQSDVTLQKKVH